MARVNLDLRIEERYRYIDWMRELARTNDVPPDRDPFDLADPAIKAATEQL